VNRNLLTPTLLILALVLMAACGSPSSTGNTTTAPAASSSVPESDTSAAATSRPGAESDTATAEPVTTKQTRDIKDISGSLDGLKSYRLHFTFAFDGKDEQGKPQQGSMEFVQEVINASQDRHLRFISTGDSVGASGAIGTFDFYQVGGTTYIYAPDGQNGQQCIGGMGGEEGGVDLSSAFKPSDIIGGLKEARLVGKGEIVNGVKADHYSFDQSAITFGTFASAGGDAWIAQDGGFIVKYVGTATGKNTALSSNVANGTFTWEYNVQDANQLEAIELPKACESAKPADDIPMPPNATSKSGFGRMLTFNTPDAPADVAAFYQQELVAQGWTSGDQNAMGDTQLLSFTKEQRKLSITVTREDSGGSTVLISEDTTG
jgi:hypothetical protein